VTARILLVEDDRTLRTALGDALAGEGHAVATAADGDEALAMLRGETFGLLVLDVMLPGPSGLEILRALRQRDRRTPVLLLTARSSEGDKVLGLELGADDYVTKPFSLRELLARVRALLRRAVPAGGEPALDPTIVPTGRFRLGGCEVDLDAYELRRAGAVQRLSPKEAAMLALLWSERGKVVSRARFLREVWSDGGQSVGDRTVDTHLLHLRQKLEDDPRAPVWIVTVHGAGYRLSVDGGRP
jgi:two-component system, OmpR family, alkaline phosphatase synthesis response regulator PhoP